MSKGLRLAIIIVSVTMFCLSLVFTVLINTSFRSFVVTGRGMEPTLEVGDSVTKRPLRAIERGTLIVYPSPREKHVFMVQRVVALPGETVQIHDKELRINGAALDEPYKMHTDEQLSSEGRDQYGPYRLPDDCYFVLGDNRDEAQDSRSWGCIGRKTIEGEVFFVLSARKGLWRP